MTNGQGFIQESARSQRQVHTDAVASYKYKITRTTVTVQPAETLAGKNKTKATATTTNIKQGEDEHALSL